MISTKDIVDTSVGSGLSTFGDYYMVKMLYLQVVTHISYNSLQHV